MQVQARRIRELRLTKTLNGWESTKIIHGAIGPAAAAARGEGLLCRYRGASGAERMITLGGKCSLAPSSAQPFAPNETFAPFVAAADVLDSDVALLKIDCDGCEVQLFDELRPLLAVHRVQYILAELSREDTWPEDLMRSHGYVAFVVDTDGGAGSCAEPPSALAGRLPQNAAEGLSAFADLASLLAVRSPDDDLRLWNAHRQLPLRLVPTLLEWLGTGKASAALDVLFVKN